MRSIDPNIKALALPLLAIPVLLILFVAVVSNGYSKVSKQLEEINQIRQKEEVLENKLELLRNIKEGILEQTDVSVIALPENNPAWQTLSLIKKYLQEEPLVLKKIGLEGGGAGNEDVRSFDLSVQLTSSDRLVPGISYIKNLLNSLPVVTFSEVGIEKASENEVDFNTKGSIYWSEFPEKLPPLEEPIKDLTDSEKQLLEKISEMNKPELTILEPGSPSDRENPFF